MLNEEDYKDLVDLKIVDTTQLLELVTRKKRNDAGKTRAKYTSDLPSKYRSYLYGANKRQLEFELTLEEFDQLIKSPCVYCGTNSKIGVDRKDNSEGYTKDNSQPCCTTCNIMKYTHSEQEFISHIKKILRHLS